MNDLRAVARLVMSVVAIGALVACGSSSGEEPDDGDDPGSIDGGTPTTPADAGDASVPGEPPPPVTPPPAPLGPVGEWTWIETPGAVCGLGQPTGFAVNVGTSTDVLIYMEGGGLCWDEISCQFAIPGFTSLASYFMSGYTEATFRGNPPRSGIFDRAHPKNPYKDSTIVYIPYCTGDFHAGTTEVPFPNLKTVGHFAGRKNLDLYLEKIVPAFVEKTRITLSGTSAGGFGSLINFGHIRDAFGKTRVDLVSDSAPALWPNSVIMNGLPAWNGRAAFPEDCADCKRDLRAIYAFYSAKYPDSRLAVTSFDQDLAMSVGGYTLTPYPGFYNAMHDLTAGTLKPLPNFKYFITEGTTHGELYNLDNVSQPHGCNWFLWICLPKVAGVPMTLGDWLTRMHSDDPAWTSQTSIIE